MAVVDRSLICHSFHLEDPQSIEDVAMKDAWTLAFDRRLSSIEKMLRDKDLMLADDIAGMDTDPIEVGTML